MADRNSIAVPIGIFLAYAYTAIRNANPAITVPVGDAYVATRHGDARNDADRGNSSAEPERPS